MTPESMVSPIPTLANLFPLTIFAPGVCMRQALSIAGIDVLPPVKNTASIASARTPALFMHSLTQVAILAHSALTVA
ncbi:MAG TPA: hypothetical protein VED87_09655, partial [Methylocystis sp.]|nr:hypothetical protein [Methylocystis sp.]